MRFDLNKMISVMIPLSMLIFALRGKFGAVIISIMTIMILYAAKGKVKKSFFNMLYFGFIFIFAFVCNIVRTNYFQYYMIIGYFAVSVIFLCGNLKMFDEIWKYLRYIAIFEAFGVFLQRLLPTLYYPIISIILPNNVVDSIYNRFASGYCTGFSREVSYTMFLIGLGLAICIFNIYHNKKKTIFDKFIILFLFLALAMSGKRATFLFSIITFFVISFIKSDNRLKILKYSAIGFSVVALGWISFSFWSKLNALSRLVELVSYLQAKDMVGITNGRILIYEDAINLWKNNEIFGIGWGNFKYLSAKDSWYTGYDVHNCFLQVLCENGIVGGIYFYLLTVLSLYRCVYCILLTRNKNKYYYKLSLISGYIQIYFVLYSFTEPILYEYTDYVIYFIAVFITNNIMKEIKKSRALKVAIK